MILDEAHNIRTHITKKGEGVKGEGVNASNLIECAKYSKKVLLLTATPLINKISDINNLMAMVNGSDPIPESAFKYLSNDIGELENYFDCKISIYSPPLNEIKDKFPEKREEDIFIKMSPDYLEKYEEIERNELDPEKRNNLFGGTGDLTVFYNGVRRASNNLDEKMSPKIQWIMKKIEENPDSKFLIFSHFLDAGLGLMIANLNDNNIKFDHIDGSMTISNRKKAVDNYNSGKVNILLISKAGGEGLDLKETKFVIILEPSWNDSTLLQVIGRAVRYESHINLRKKDQIVYVYKLHMFKPVEEEFLDSIVNEHKVNSPVKDILLSVDLYLRNFSYLKQVVIDEFMEKIKKSSIEVKKCNDKVNYKDDFGQRFEDTEKREKERQKQEKETQKREKERQKREKQDARQDARKNARQNKYQPPPPPPRPVASSYRKNCEDIFLREKIIDDKLPPNITKDIKDSINHKWKRWSVVNHPDKKAHSSDEEYVKNTQLFQSVTDCKEKVMRDDLYDELGQGCNVM